MAYVVYKTSCLHYVVLDTLQTDPANTAQSRLQIEAAAIEKPLSSIIAAPMLHLSSRSRFSAL